MLRLLDLVTPPVRSFFLHFQRIPRFVWFALSQHTWQGPRIYGNPRRCWCLTFSHTEQSQAKQSRWLSTALRLPGVEVGFSGHSTRGAATSAAAAAGLSVELILEAADWASERTFEQFYHRKSSASAFALAVLNSYILLFCMCSFC